MQACYYDFSFTPNQVHHNAIKCICNTSSVKEQSASGSGRGAEYCDVWRACLYLCVCMYMSKTTCPNLTKLYLHITYGRRLPPFGSIAICYILPDVDGLGLCHVSTQWPGIGDTK